MGDGCALDQGIHKRVERALVGVYTIRLGCKPRLAQMGKLLQRVEDDTVRHVGRGIRLCETSEKVVTMRLNMNANMHWANYG